MSVQQASVPFADRRKIGEFISTRAEFIQVFSPKMSDILATTEEALDTKESIARLAASLILLDDEVVSLERFLDLDIKDGSKVLSILEDKTK